MPLTSFTVERYRSFVEPTTLEIRPLTLLFGYNSSGKSALARVLPLLRDSMGGAMYGPLALDSEVLRDAAYGDIRSRLDERNQMNFELSWEGEPSDMCHLEFRLRDLGKEGHVLEQLIARDGRKLELIELRDEPGQKGQYQVKAKGQKPFHMQLTFEGLKPSYEDIRRVGKGAVPESFRKLIELCAARLQSLKERFGDQLKWVVERDFHAKGLLGDDYFLSGSMNLTFNGISVNGEHLILRTDPAAMAEQAEQLHLQWEGRLR